MAVDGSDSHGDGDTLPQYRFGSDFDEYVLKEQLKWSLNNRNVYGLSKFDRWVFWSEQDHEIEPSLSLDNCADFNLNVCAIPKVRDNIRRALQKLMLSRPLFYGRLVQFWVATKTLEGRTLLTTRYEPFALGGAFGPGGRARLCNYRMEMCRKYNCFYADAESGEEQLGLPGRVFLHQFPESIPKVEYYTPREYPQRDLALRCEIQGSCVVPVFEHSSQTCVGVLEIVCWRYSYPVYGLDKYFLDNYSYELDLPDNVNKIFQVCQ